MNHTNDARRFPLGKIFATPAVIELLDGLGMIPQTLIARHVSGDWGDLDEEDRAENERSLREGYRLISSYVLADGQKVWVITEADRSVTTLLLPEEY